MDSKAYLVDLYYVCYVPEEYIGHLRIGVI